MRTVEKFDYRWGYKFSTYVAEQLLNVVSGR